MMWPATTMAFTASQRQALLTLAAGASAATAWYNSTMLESAVSGEVNSKNNSYHNADNQNPIEINLMDKIASKVYLNPSRAKNTSNQRNNNADATIAPDSMERPLGVPSRLRILAIDLPEMRQQAFSKGTCRVALNRVFPDGVAPAKQLEGSDGNGNHQHHTSRQLLQVEQKAFVKSLVQCFQEDLPGKVGVEMMEASFADMNPKNLRKTRQVGGFHYDPGKYTQPGGGGGDAKAEKDSTTNNAVEEYHEVEADDEMDAPWNQYAWIEELDHRVSLLFELSMNQYSSSHMTTIVFLPKVHGFVPFGDSLEPSSRWSRYLSGNIFKRTIPSQRSSWELLLPPFWQSDPEGVEGGGSHNNKHKERSNNNWASNKPHAVIANGAAVQRVPSGLRVLQKTCREANVPLFILYDPRAWGSNTHNDLTQALKDIRFIVKQNIILQAMEQQSGFSRGRLVGRMERQIEQVAQQAKKDRQRRQEAVRRRQWDKYDAASLEKRLIEHGVMRREDRVEDGRTYRRYTPAMVEIARRCVADEAELGQSSIERGQQDAAAQESDTN